MPRPAGDGRDEQPLVLRPFVLVEKERGALRLAALDAVAVRLGLKPGMALAEARAIVPHLDASAADPAADAGILARAAEACEMFTPLVALQDTPQHPSQGLILDITGSAHLFGGEEKMLRRARRRIAALGLASTAAIAGTPDAAWAFARHGGTGTHRERIIAPGDEEAMARHLPLAALGCEGAVLVALSRAGFRSLGDLADRPSQLLTARFGTDLPDALRRILGQEDIRITPLRAAPEIMAEKHFPEPLALMESLLAVLERLMRDLATRLQHRDAGGRAFEASFFRADGVVRRLVIETARGTRDAASLMRLMRLRIEALADPIDPGFGFDAVRLAVLRSEPLVAMQPGLDHKHPAGKGGDGQTIDTAREDGAAGIAALVDRLVARFGSGDIRRFIQRDTHDPVRAGTTVPYLSGGTGEAPPAPEPDQAPTRPLTLFEPPQLIEAIAEVPDGPPLRFRWRRVLHEVARAEGPERIAPEWWRFGNNAPATRDYYRIEDANGHRFWVFREGFFEDSTARPRWFLHGLFA